MNNSTIESLKARRLMQRSFQLLVFLAGKMLLVPLTRTKALGVNPILIQNRPYVLIANHRGWIDPFVICSGMPAKTIFKIIPINFMTKNIFYDSPLRPLLWLSGAYPARNPNEKHRLFGVGGSIKLLEAGFSIFIFPEGTRIKSGRGPSHSGVVRIHEASPKTPMILCHIEYNRGLKALLKRERRVVSYRLIENPQYNNAEEIMDDVFSL